MSGNERLHELDSLRALAAIGVIAWHYTNHFHASPFPGLMAPFYGHGMLLVDFFFVLSGFVLARTYWNEKRSPNFSSNLRDRVARLYPLHFVMLCLVAIMQWVLVQHLDSSPFVYAFNDKREFALNLLLLNRTGLERGFSFNAPSWSISAEFVVNFAFLAVISTRRKVSSVLVGIGFVVALAAMFRNGLISSATFFGIDNDIFRATFGFCIGVALFRINDVFDKVSVPRPAYDLLAVASTACFLYYCAGSRFSSAMDLAITLVCFPTLIVGAMRGAVVNKVLKLPPLVFLGTISYSIYLVHFPMQLAAHITGIASGHELPYNSRSFFVAFFIATIALSWLTYRTIELPGKNLMRKLLGHRNQTTAAHQG
ncbi:acyltransferase [Burkholderia pyrrocinia]|uniref:acyltransferase family protein n=1 Tax=Burkholderia pyrrocinia TaxID=60550 RepID=UPI001575338E|nr:acyltransferase [Burkholderia pyrrocinia]NTX29573.1 acyltransferase [Burkholderia pyrrocinia]QVN19280.1 acyltransferase [Burkholderia pyrrocinia]